MTEHVKFDDYKPQTLSDKSVVSVLVLYWVF